MRKDSFTMSFEDLDWFSIMNEYGGQSEDAEKAAAAVREAEQALEDAKAEAKEALARVKGNAETDRVTAIAANMAAEKAALEKERKGAAGEQDAAAEPAAEGDIALKSLGCPERIGVQ